MAQEILIQKGLPMWAKGVVAVAATGLVVFAVYEVSKAFKNAANKKDNKKTVNDATKELDDLLKGGMKLSNPLSTYDSTTEFQQVKNILSVVKNQADWLQLIKSFGVRSISDCGSFGYAHTNYDLPTLLKDQMDSHALLVFEKIGNKSYNGFLLSYDILAEQLKNLGITL
jgi:hypothetical protein